MRRKHAYESSEDSEVSGAHEISEDSEEGIGRWLVSTLWIQT